ncbi:hypothetical protein GDO81_000013 [Engystomops pustulosus]|uniref:Uncharacterized protein n=1 Tax=Engystomops pustulosus TaxID=76066 RepID=A0AAV7D0Z7_ENGPU|nr:hypothetical protein GDO81_000013 [Engystomops pustulosus]
MRFAVKYILHLLSGRDKLIPNFSCGEHGHLAGVIGDHHSSTSVPAAQILGLYGYTQKLIRNFMHRGRTGDAYS